MRRLYPSFPVLWFGGVWAICSGSGIGCLDAVGVKRPCLAEHGKIRNVASYGKQSVCRLDLVSIGDVQGRASTVAMPHGRVVLTDLGSC